MIAANRLRKGATNSARGAASFVIATLATAKRCGAGRLTIARADSAFYTAEVVAAIRRAGARFSLTARQSPAMKRAIAGIDEDSWTPTRYPNAIWEPDETHPASD